jgi:transposase
MRRHELSNEQWQKLKKVLPKGIGRPPKLSDRRFINAVLWKVKTGVPWRDLPRRYGSWKTVYSRFRRWALAGHFQAIFEALQLEVDDNWNAIDGTYIRVHQHAAGGKGGRNDSALEEAVVDILQRSMRAWMHKEGRGKSK